jgi:hypothetical protein
MHNLTMQKQLMKCIVLAGMIAGAALTPLQAQTPRQIHVTVTDPLNRFVTGLELEHFELVQQGIPRSITGLIPPGSPITIAVVGEALMQGVRGVESPGDLLIQTSSIADALKQLAASTNARKCLLITTPTTENLTIPGGIEAQVVDQAKLSRAIIELRNQYVLLVELSIPGQEFEIVLKQPPGLPTLRPSWKPIALK